MPWALITTLASMSSTGVSDISSTRSCTTLASVLSAQENTYMPASNSSTHTVAVCVDEFTEFRQMSELLCSYTLHALSELEHARSV